MTPLGQSPLALGDIVVHSLLNFRWPRYYRRRAITNRKDVGDALYLLQNGTGTALSRMIVGH